MFYFTDTCRVRAKQKSPTFFSLGLKTRFPAHTQSIDAIINASPWAKLYIIYTPVTCNRHRRTAYVHTHTHMVILCGAAKASEIGHHNV